MRSFFLIPICSITLFSQIGMTEPLAPQVNSEPGSVQSQVILAYVEEVGQSLRNDEEINLSNPDPKQPSSCDFLMDRSLDPDVEQRLSSKQLLDAWSLYKQIRNNVLQPNTQLHSNIPSDPELNALAIHSNNDPEKVVSQLQKESAGSFLILTVFWDHQKQTNDEMHLYYKDTFGGVRRIEFKNASYELATIELYISFLKALGILKEPLKSLE